MNIALWVVQILLAVQFLIHGVIMLAPPADASAMLQYISDLPSGLRVFIGVVELLAAAGLVLPGLLKIQPRLTPLAALGLTLVMASAMVFHMQRGESFGGNVILFILAAFVAYGRWRVRPLQGRVALQRRVA